MGVVCGRGGRVVAWWRGGVVAPADRRLLPVHRRYRCTRGRGGGFKPALLTIVQHEGPQERPARVRGRVSTHADTRTRTTPRAFAPPAAHYVRAEFFFWKFSARGVQACAHAAHLATPRYLSAGGMATAIAAPRGSAEDMPGRPWLSRTTTLKHHNCTWCVPAVPCACVHPGLLTHATPRHVYHPHARAGVT